MPAGLGPELDIIIEACVPATAAQARKPGDEQAIDWRKLRELAAAHRVQGLVRRHLIDHPSYAAPTDVLGELETAHRRHALGYLSNAAETLRLVARLEGAGIETIVLKGCAVAQAFYAPEPELKQSMDIDILVAPESFSRADSIARAAGYVRELPRENMPERADSMARYLVNSYEYARAAGGTRLELHHRLLVDPHTLAVPFATLLARSAPIPLGGRSIRGLGRDDLLIYLACHGAGHAYGRLKWLADFARVAIQLSEAEIEAAIARAREVGGLRALSLSLELLKQSGGWIVPPRVQELLEIRGILVEAARKAIVRGMRESDLALTDLPQHLRAMRYGLMLADSARSRRFLAMKYLVNPEDVHSLGLGIAWRPLYAVLGRPLAGLRYLRRLLSGIAGRNVRG